MCVDIELHSSVEHCILCIGTLQILKFTIGEKKLVGLDQLSKAI